MDAVRSSEWVQDCERLVATTGDEAVRRTLRILLDPPEIWARSYAQFIATRGAEGSPRRTELDACLHFDPLVQFAEQWDPIDFDPIDLALRNAFDYWGW